MNWLPEMSWFYFIVFMILVGLRKDSDRDGIRIHARRSYRSSSPTPKAVGDTRHFLTKHKQCCLYCSCLFLSIAKFIQHPERIKVYSPLWASFWQFFSNWMFSILDNEFVAWNELLVFRRVYVSRRCPQVFRQRWDSNTRTETLFD